MSDSDLIAAAPALVLAVSAAGVALVGRWRGPAASGLAWIGVGASAAAGAVAIVAGPGAAGPASTLARDGATTYLTVLVAIGTAGALLLPDRRRGPRRGDEVAQALLSAAGASLMVSAADAVVLFAAFALFVLPLQTLAARGGAGRSLVGATALAVVAYGLALLYTASGETAYVSLGRATRNPLYLAGLALALAGLASHASLLPFGGWSGAVHDAGRATASVLVAIVGRVAVFGALLRLAAATKSGETALDWEVSLATLAAISIAVAALASLRERRLGRILACFATVQAGYVAIALAAFSGPAAAFALAVDAALLLGAFALVTVVAAEAPTLDDLAGLARQRPLAVVALGVILLGLAGLPPAAGFLSRLAVFEAAVRAQLLWLVVVGALASVASAACGLRILFACFAPPRLDAVAPPRSRRAVAVMLAAAVAAIAAGVVPGPLLEAAQAVRY